MSDLPILKLQPQRERRVAGGHPWIYSNEVTPDAGLGSLAPGSLVKVAMADGRLLGIATYNPKTLIAARFISRDADEPVDKAFFDVRLARAADLRRRLIGTPYCRLVHAEADELPGFIVDRYGDVAVVQLNTAGAEALREPFLAALQEFAPSRAIVLKNDSPAREQEGLETQVEIVRGNLDEPVIIEENGARFAVELVTGQKTGWFYDQRDNRAFVARLAAERASVLDVYTYAGGFAVQAARAGASSVLAVDRSEGALELVSRAAVLNGVENLVSTRRGDAFKVLEELVGEQRRFTVVIADPPAFIKSRKDHPQGMRAYAKLARLSAQLVEPGGILFIASCSHHAAQAEFAGAVAKGIAAAGRTGRILRSSGAASDHPVHPFLPESAYLKALTLQLD